LRRLREYLALDALVHGVPWNLQSIMDAMKKSHPDIPPDYQELQKLADIDRLTAGELIWILIEACHSGFVRALPTNEKGEILPRVENEPVDTEIDKYYFEISNRGKLRWKELESV
jgi:hypothetical protein